MSFKRTNERIRPENTLLSENKTLKLPAETTPKNAEEKSGLPKNPIIDPCGLFQLIGS